MSNSSFFWHSPFFGMLKKQPKISGIALFCISIKLRPSYFCINSKVFFQQRAYTCLSHLNTNLFFSLHLCPIGNTLTYSVRNYPVVSQSLTGLCNLVGPHNLLNCRGDSSVLLAYLFLLLFGIGKLIIFTRSSRIHCIFFLEWGFKVNYFRECNFTLSYVFQRYDF